MSWVLAKEDKGDTVLAIQFIAGGVWRTVDQQQDGTLSLSKWVGERIAKHLVKASLQLHSNSFSLKQLFITVKLFYY